MSNKRNNDHTVKRTIARVIQFGLTEFNVFNLTVTKTTSTMTTISNSATYLPAANIVITKDHPVKRYSQMIVVLCS